MCISVWIFCSWLCPVSHGLSPMFFHSGLNSSSHAATRRTTPAVLLVSLRVYTLRHNEAHVAALIFLSCLLSEVSCLVIRNGWVVGGLLALGRCLGPGVVGGRCRGTKAAIDPENVLGGPTGAGHRGGAS
ncbi:hypothetical protein B0H67DRAFT_573111, partial [Lasiosphaeris hirsuta]